MERNPLPEKLISWLDIAKGLGEVALELFTKRFLHESPSNHIPESHSDELLRPYGKSDMAE